ncbi:MAG: hypothetical protein L3J71_05470 [Victivallaceae bacterium]|nr:hypothetical protein [Victivallaceae bacterium]
MIKRLKIKEFHETAYCPAWLRDYLTDFLSFFTYHMNPYKPVCLLLKNALVQSKQTQIVDFCTGNGRYMIKILRNINGADGGCQATVCDKFPNQQSVKELAVLSGGQVEYMAESVDLLDIQQMPAGFRTIFSGIHHFDETTIKIFLRSAIEQGCGVAFFDYTKRTWFNIIIPALLVPGLVWGVTPFIRPFSWRRLLFTYIIPLVPLLVMVDGCISNWKAYSPAEFTAMVAEFTDTKHEWQIGEQRSIFGTCPITYLIGYPKK